jgi:hypothetical protein
MAHITLDEFKALPLGLKDSIFEKIGDPAIQTFINTATTQVDNYCNRQLASAAVEQEMAGTGAQYVILREYPMTALASVTWEDELGQTGTEDVTKLRFTSSGIVSWKNPLYGPFLTSRYYTFTYTAGYTTIPGPIKQATALWVTELLQPTFNQGQQGKATGLVELSSEQIGELLEEYRRKGGR